MFYYCWIVSSLAISSEANFTFRMKASDSHDFYHCIDSSLFFLFAVFFRTRFFSAALFFTSNFLFISLSLPRSSSNSFDSFCECVCVWYYSNADELYKNIPFVILMGGGGLEILRNQHESCH